MTDRIADIISLPTHVRQQVEAEREQALNVAAADALLRNEYVRHFGTASPNRAQRRAYHQALRRRQHRRVQ